MAYPSPYILAQLIIAIWRLHNDARFGAFRHTATIDVFFFPADIPVLLSVLLPLSVSQNVLTAALKKKWNNTRISELSFLMQSKENRGIRIEIHWSTGMSL
jgi:hypothetical protein